MAAGSRSSRRARCVAQKDTAWQRVPRQELPTKEKTCYECGGPHLARNCPAVKCYRCGGSHLARGCSRPYKMDSLKHGDWLCASCGDHQFARNTECRMCGAAKPACGDGNSIKERPDMSSSTTEEDDAVVSKNECRMLTTKEHPVSSMVRPDSVKTSKKPLGGHGGKSWADIVDEEEEHEEEASRMNTPSISTSAEGSDASSQVDNAPNSPSEDCVLPRYQSDMALVPPWQQFWEEPMTGVAGNGLANGPEYLGEAVEVGKAAAMNPETCLAWPVLWWPTYSEEAAPPAMPQCPNGHQLVDGVITALDNYICDGCGSKVQSNEHVMECSPCNWGLCKRFCCGEATVLNPGDRVKSLCAEPSWNPRPLQIGDEGTVVDNLPDCRVSVDFNGVIGWLYAINLEKCAAGDSCFRPA